MTFWTKMLDAAVQGKIPEKMISPYARFLSLPLAGSWEGKTIRCQWEAHDQVHQDAGMVFGGYLSVLADHVAASTMMTIMQDNEIFFTKKLEIEYKKPIRSGTVNIEGAVIEHNETSALVEVTLRNHKGELLAVAKVQQSIFAR
jgi:uncharacterized protein (TIGR00369 family)